jgi:hypothetical protein
VKAASGVSLLVEPEHDLGSADEDGPLDQVGLFHHQVNRLLLRGRQRPRLEDGATGADEIQKRVGLDVPLEKGAIRRIAVDVPFFDLDVALFQITSGIATGRSSRLPVEDGLGHGPILGHRIRLWIPTDGARAADFHGPDFWGHRCTRIARI